MKLTCHDREIRPKESKIITSVGKEFGYLQEFLLEGHCTHCNTLILVHLFLTYDGMHHYTEYRGKKAIRFLSKVLQKDKIYKAKKPDYRMYLNYSEYGKVKKCYSNLSSMKMGLRDPEEGLDFFAA